MLKQLAHYYTLTIFLYLGNNLSFSLQVTEDGLDYQFRIPRCVYFYISMDKYISSDKIIHQSMP